jgi:hypothetical protein
MPVILLHSDDARRSSAIHQWVAIGDTSCALDADRRRSGISAALEQAFDDVAPVWFALGKQLATDPSAHLAHAPACATNASDLGLMLAWSELVRRWALETDTTLLVCDDPWLFRHLRHLAGVRAGKAPYLASRVAKLWLRGWAARTVVSLRVCAAAIRLRQQKAITYRSPTLLVYGHPASDAAGTDGYFGDLMRKQKELRRILHVDCPPARALALAQDKRTTSLHAFGQAWFALTLPFARWRPTHRHLEGRHRWLIRRAAALEGGTGQAAAIRWQVHCQQRWLTHCRPSVVSWPWENHSWEREFVRVARTLNIPTVGYQHSVIGQKMLNYAASSNPDGSNSIPDRIFCTGAATRDLLQHWQVPSGRLTIAGALRFQWRRVPAYAADAPVFLALPFDGATAAEMLDAARRCAETSHRRFVVKSHPMTPFEFESSLEVARTDQPLELQPTVSAVVYAATTVGLEAILAGLPTLRFRPRSRIAIDILPAAVTVTAVDADNMCAALDRAERPTKIVDANSIFAPVNWDLWRDALSPA